MNAIRILKNRSDIGAGTRGSDMGIDALEIAAINSGHDFFNRHPFIDIPTHNETVYDKVKNTTAKRINFVAAQCERLKLATKQALKEGFFPLILSGDHSSALGSLAGIKSAFPCTFPEGELKGVCKSAWASIHNTPSFSLLYNEYSFDAKILLMAHV